MAAEPCLEFISVVNTSRGVNEPGCTELESRKAFTSVGNVTHRDTLGPERQQHVGRGLELMKDFPMDTGEYVSSLGISQHIRSIPLVCGRSYYSPIPPQSQSSYPIRAMRALNGLRLLWGKASISIWP